MKLSILFGSAFALSAFFALTTATEARAADATASPASASPAPATAAPPTAASTKENPDARPTDDPFRSIALTANPLSFVLGRFGVNFEYLPAAHHALVLNPFGQFTSAGEENSATGKTTYTNVGGEVGYRFYTGNRGANGFFVGPFFTVISASSSTAKAASTTSPKSDSEASFLAYGGGVDLGGQHVFKNGFTIGGGAGLMYLKSGSTGSTSSLVKFEGVLPRFLLTAGYSF